MPDSNSTILDPAYGWPRPMPTYPTYPSTTTELVLAAKEPVPVDCAACKRYMQVLLRLLAQQERYVDQIPYLNRIEKLLDRHCPTGVQPEQVNL
jgi:hypothetical protein